MKVAHRLYLLSSILIIVTIVVLFGGLKGMSVAVNGLNNVYKDRVVPLRDLKVIADMYAVNIVDTSHKARNKNISYQEAKKNVLDAENIINEKWKAYLATELVPEEKKLINEIEPLMSSSQKNISKLKDLLDKGDDEGLARFTAEELYPVIDPISNKFSELIEVQLVEAKKEYDYSSAVFKRTKLIDIVLALLGIVVGITLSYRITKKIVNQLGGEPDYVNSVANSIAGGVLNVNIAVKSGDRSSIVSAMDNMKNNLRSVIQKISSESDELSAASAQLASSANQVAVSSDQQSEAAASMAAAIEEMTVSINNISMGAEEARGAAFQAIDLAKTGLSVVSKSAVEMNKLKEVVNSTAIDINNLADMSEQINSIVNVIRDIADQTNLLALNAAIEAARAGEQGRGFAVVADEVRKLAERTSSSTKEIVEIVHSIQIGTEKAIKSMTSGLEQVNAGVATAKEAGNSMEMIKEGIDKTLSAVDEISNALREQGEASNLVSNNVEKVAQMTEENSLAVRNITDAANQLNKLAVSQKCEVDRFKI